MNIVIIDERKGSELREDAREALSEADALLIIDPDNTIRITRGMDERHHNVQFFDAVHRDVLSGEESDRARIEREKVKDSDTTYRMPIEDKIAAGQAPEGNHGTEKIVEG